MSTKRNQPRKTQVLVLAPVGRDATLICDTLQRANIDARNVGSVDILCQEMQADAGVVIIAEEALNSASQPRIIHCLHRQEPWSDLPLILLTGRAAQGTARELEAADHIRALGHVTLLERPVRIQTLVIAVRAALRTRHRQYDVRDNLIELKNAEREIRIISEQMAGARDEAQHASQVKSRFLATMSHELRTPLNAILGYAEMMEEELHEKGMENLLEDARNISQAGRHLLMLINDVLDLSKIEADQMTLVNETFDVRDLVYSVSRTITPLVMKNSNIYELICPETVGECIGDEIKLRQSLLNLLSNACKFTENGRISLEVSKEGNNGTGWYVFHVRDNGPGMRPEDLDRIGTDFMQLDSSSTRRYGGTGLGLSLTRRFCEMMGGALMAESQVGMGSTFTIRLPVIQSN